jgi:hypothetical protein
VRSRSSHSWWRTIAGTWDGSPTAIRHAHASSGGWIVAVMKSRRDRML